MTSAASATAACAAFLRLDPDLLRSPHVVFDELRRHGPVVKLDAVNLYAVTRFETICTVTRDWERFSNVGVLGPGGRHDQTGTDRSPAALLTADPPAHRVHRRLVQRAFSPRRLREREDSIRTLANELIDGFVHDGRFDFIRQYAKPLPMFVIADAMGVPRSDWQQFAQWSAALLRPVGNPYLSDEELAEQTKVLRGFFVYFADVMRQRRIDPGQDVISDLVAPDEDGEPALSDRETLAIIGQFLVGGNETTTKMMASAMRLLLSDKELYRRVRADHGLIPDLLVESLRLASPVHGMFRRCIRDTELEGVSIPAGATLWLLYSSGNRDDAVFSDPTELRLDRPNRNSQLAFGHGPHHCIGSNLAQLEGRIGLEILFDRLGDIRLATDNTFEPAKSFVINGIRELSLEFDSTVTP